MNKFIFTFLLIPFYSFGQEFTPEMFSPPINTGTNMSVAFIESKFDQFEGSQVAAFYDLSGNGEMECVGLGDVISDFFIFTIWGNDATNTEIDGLLDGDVPFFALLTPDGKIIFIEDIISFSGYSTNGLVFSNQSTLSASSCNNPFSCNFEIFNYSVDQVVYNCQGVIGCMNSDYIEYDANATCNNLSCLTPVLAGCNNSEAYNFDNLVNMNDGSCLFSGCMNELYFEFDSNASLDNGSCSVLILLGCMNDAYVEFDSMANIEDESCQNTWNSSYLNLIIASNSLLDSLEIIEDFLNLSVLEIQSELEIAMSNQEDGVNQMDVDAIQIELSQANLSLSISSSDLLFANGSINTLTGDLSDAVDSISSLDTSLSLSQGELASANSTIDDLTSNLDSAGISILTLEQNLSITLSELSSSNTINTGLSSDLATANSAISGLDSTLLSTQDELASTVLNLVSTQDNLELALSNQEDGIGQVDVDTAYQAGIASVIIEECEEIATENIPLNLPVGWSMFGYTCLNSIDAMEGFASISEDIVLVKDAMGSGYLPEYGFNGIGNLNFGNGYQIKMIEAITTFQFCSTLIAP